MDEIFNDRRVKPVVHPEHQLVGDPHYLGPRTVAFVAKEPPGMARKTARWRVHQTTGSELGTGSVTGGTAPLRRRREALDIFEQVKSGADLYDAEAALMAQKREAARLRRQGPPL